MRNVLVVSSVPDAPRELLEALGGDVEVKVVAPAVKQSRLQWLTNAEDDARAEAERTAEKVAQATADEAEHVEAEAGDSDPLLAVEDALRTFQADEIVVRPARRRGRLVARGRRGRHDRRTLPGAPGEDDRSPGLTSSRFWRVAGKHSEAAQCTSTGGRVERSQRRERTAGAGSARPEGARPEARVYMPIEW